MGIDLRRTRNEALLPSKGPRFGDAVANLAVPIHGHAAREGQGRAKREAAIAFSRQLASEGLSRSGD